MEGESTMDNKRTTTREMGRRSFVPLFVTNLFGTLNDNFLKTLASFIVIGWIDDPSLKPVFMGGMEGVAFLGVLVGTILTSLAVDRCAPWVQWSRLSRLEFNRELEKWYNDFES